MRSRVRLRWCVFEGLGGGFEGDPMLMAVSWAMRLRSLRSVWMCSVW